MLKDTGFKNAKIKTQKIKIVVLTHDIGKG